MKTPNPRQIHPLVLILLALTFATTAIFAHNQAREPGDLPHPAATTPSPENLTTVLDVARTNEPPLLNTPITVDHRDRHAFRLHLRSAAFQQGWYIYDRPQGGYGLVLPASELSQVQDLQTDPIRWVLSRTAHPSKAQGPSDLDLVHLHLSISSSSTLTPKLWTILAILATGAATFCLFSGLGKLSDPTPHFALL